MLSSKSFEEEVILKSKYVLLFSTPINVDEKTYEVWEIFKAKFYRRVATYVADWKDNQNEGSRDRAPGLGTEAIEPPDWHLRFCEVWDTGLRDFVLANMADPGNGLLPWQRAMASASSIIEAMNYVTLEDEEDGELMLNDAEKSIGNDSFSGLNPRLCAIAGVSKQTDIPDLLNQMPANKKGVSVVENKKRRTDSSGLGKDIEMGLNTELHMDSDVEEIMEEENNTGLGPEESVNPKNVLRAGSVTGARLVL
ncbi:hypothetical protein POM88_028132 [Heracleum sosnowskyi]|uniref:Uncharacterized protein n=1 Tax=Heracleum sosnowskyi TaxID=360622 RepID=A0AAD8IA07_9APIA|nr:hypothetical protein POM88_028127 [Heracleum sosnowskyi]KAK1381388.1 hypothetical protein POM88_028132 [Heracleum sosnowskyi]